MYMYACVYVFVHLGVWVEKVELETSSYFGVSGAGLWVWCSRLRLVV